MQAGWTALNVGASSDAVKALETFKTNLQGVVNAVETIVSIAKTVADLIVKFYFELNNLQAEALKAAITALREAIEDLTSSAGSYFLFVPMRVVDPYAWAGDPQNYYLKNRDAVHFPFLETVPGPAYVTKPSEGNAGNYGFFSQVYESLQDQQDFMRPQFDRDAYVTASVLLFGADTFMELVLLAKKLERLFRLPGVNLDNAAIPSPRNLTARAVPTPLSGNTVLEQYMAGDGDFSTQPFSVRLDWDVDDKDWLLTAYGNARFQIREFIVNRWEEGTYTKEQIIPQVSSGDESTIILRSEYDRVSLAIDAGIEFGKTYWYSVGYLIDILDDNGNVTQSLNYPLDIATARIAIPQTIKMAPRHGIPPDWFAIPLFSSIPALDQAVGWILTWLDTVEKSIVTGKDDIEKFIEFLQREITRYSRMVNDITSTINEIIDALTWPNVFAGIWVMPIGKGGNNYFTAQLAQALFNAEDRPPFEKGTEAVTGVVMYSGSETAGKIEKFITSIEFLFGAFTAQTENALKVAADSMHALDADVDRQICLTQGLIKKACTEMEATAPAIGKDLQPSKESAACADTGTGSVTEG